MPWLTKALAAAAGGVTLVWALTAGAAAGPAAQTAPTASGTPTLTPTPTPTRTPTLTPLRSATVTPTPTSSPPVRSASILGRRPLPRRVLVAPGQVVMWRNLDRVPHALVSDDAPFLFDLPARPAGRLSLLQGSTYSRSFTATGLYRYSCLLHPTLKGEILVRVPPPRRQR